MANDELPFRFLTNAEFLALTPAEKIAYLARAIANRDAGNLEPTGLPAPKQSQPS